MRTYLVSRDIAINQFYPTWRVFTDYPTALHRRKIEAVLAVEYMSPEESAYETNSDEEGPRRMTKLVVKQFLWRSEELTREFRTLDRKENRARSERGRRMIVRREEEG